MRSCVITYLLAAVVAIAVLTVHFAAAAVALAGLPLVAVLWRWRCGCCPRCACACAKEQKKPGNFNRMLASLLAAIFQRSISSNMRLGTAAFVTTAAVAVAPRGVSADGNSVSSKLQVHVSRPENVLVSEKATSHTLMDRNEHCLLLLHALFFRLNQLWKWTGSFSALPGVLLPAQGDVP